MDQIANVSVGGGKTLGDLFTADFITTVAGNVLSAIVILILAWMVSGWLSRRIRAIGGRNAHLDVTLFNFLGNIARYVVLAFATVIILNTFGIQTTSIVAVIGAAGLAIGLALQGTLSNVAAGVMLILFRPIKTGDFVEVNGQTGTVQEISLNYTELASTQNVQIIIPNSEVWGNTITNYSTYDRRRVEWVFSVSYGADLDVAERTIRETIMADSRAMADPEPFIQVTNLGASSVDFTTRVWCANADAWGFQTDMTRKVKVALDEAGVEIPFPTQTMIISGEQA